jgi:hypothetical protein
MSNLAAQFASYIQSLNIPIDGVSLQFDPPTDPATQVTIQYQASATPQQIAQGNAAIGTYDWTPVPQPNPTQFVSLVTADTTLESVASLLSTQYAAIQAYALNPPFVKLIWSQLKATYGPPSGPLTQAMITAIEGYAVTASMPLT